MSLEYLATAAAPRRWPVRLLAGVVAVVGVVALAFVWWSESVRRDTNEALAAAVARAEDEARVGEARVLSTLTYASPLIWSTSVGDDVRAGLRGVVEQSARDVTVRLDTLAREVTATTVLPWQSAQHDARGDVLALVTAQRERFEAIAMDARAIAVVLATPGPSSDAARAALRASGADEPAER